MPHIPNVGPEVGHGGGRGGNEPGGGGGKFHPPADERVDPPYAPGPADPPTDPPTGFTPSESIFGWSWLGEWAKNAPNADPKAAAFLQEWVDKFNKAAEDELSGGAATGTRTGVVVNNFLVALNKQSWFAEKTALWQSIQKLRYGTDVPRGEYNSLVQSYRDYVADAARRLGLVDTNGNLTFDINGADITRLIEGVDGLMLNAGSVVNGLPTPDPMAANLLLDRHFLTERTFDAEEGVPDLGPGALQDTYNWIKSLATNNYITLGDEEIWDMVFRLKREEISTQGVWDRIAGQVGDEYSFLDGTNIMNRINQFTADSDGSNWMGVSNIKNHLEPVRQTIANTWDLGLNEVNLGSIFGVGLGGDGAGTGLIIDDENAPNGERFMNSREAGQWARQQPQFKETTAYKHGMSGMVQSILGLFGAR